jgi:hypothetical protein
MNGSLHSETVSAGAPSHIGFFLRPKVPTWVQLLLKTEKDFRQNRNYILVQDPGGIHVKAKEFAGAHV